MPLYVIRSPKGGLALVSADSEMDAKLDLDNNCYGVELGELKVSEVEVDTSKPFVLELNAFTDGGTLL
jgi:hypothetical protein